MKNDHEGELILKILESFNLDPVSEVIRILYDRAYEDRINRPGKAISLCDAALEIIARQSSETLPNRERLDDAAGRSHLLLASIHLNQESELEKAELNFRKSRNMFHLMQLDYLESLAYLGSAITLRKLNELQEAINQCENAHTIASRIYTDLPQTAINSLREAIIQERAEIQKLQLEKGRATSGRPTSASGEPERKSLPVFDIVAGKTIIDARETTGLRPLRLQDYRDYFVPERTLDVTDLPEEAKTAHYVLEVRRVSEIGSGLQMNDLILIRQKTELNYLDGKRVAVLVITRPRRTCATLKTFFKYQDHYVLRGVSRRDPPIIAADYDTRASMKQYYEHYGPTDDIMKFVYDLVVSGEVVGLVRKGVWIPLQSTE